MKDRLQITEIYPSVQGESTWAGVPCTFVRLTGCPLRCTYCDSAYAFFGGENLEIREILARVREIGCPLVEVTGGEPLAQPNSILLLQQLLDGGFTALLETSGAYPISYVPREVHKIVDLKCPSSGEEHRNLWENVEFLAPHDEVKFVIGTREDYDWARRMVAGHRIADRCRAVLFSCVFGKLEPADLSRWMLEDRMYGVRMQLQAHKYIWPPDQRGV